MNLLAIPNDPTKAYLRNPKEDFLSEFNPINFNGRRFFDKVYFLNWKDYKNEEYFGISSMSVLKNKEKPLQLVKDLGVQKIDFSYPLFTEFFVREKEEIINRAKEANASIIRSFNADHAAEAGILIKEELNLPLVVSVHNMLRVTFAINQADSIVCISNCLREKCVDEYGADPNKISLIPDGIDMDLFSPKSESDINKKIDSFYDRKYKVLSVGRINPQKNLEKLLEAVKFIKDELRDVCHIHLGVGDKQNMDKILQFKNSLGLEKNSYFLGGKQKELLPFYYSWSDINLFPSVDEGLGRVSIESLACGTPVVTTNCAPTNEVVKDGYNGLTANPYDSKEIASKAIEILTNDKLKGKLKENAGKSVRKKYGIEFVMQKHCDNYKQLLP